MPQTGCIFHPCIKSVQCRRILLCVILIIVFLTVTIKTRSKILTIALSNWEEECEVCKLHIFHLKEEHMLSKIEHSQPTDGRKNKKVFPNCSKCETFQKHIEPATEA